MSRPCRGIVEASYAMPDVHWEYGFPIGGVAATDVERDGVVPPGGVGFDISCGVRLLVSDLDHDGLAPSLGRLMDELDQHVPRGWAAVGYGPSPVMTSCARCSSAGHGTR